ncbi:MAG: hypothetical protein ABIJ23_00810 [Candidatus Magasanikbacteria bacterium]
MSNEPTDIKEGLLPKKVRELVDKFLPDEFFDEVEGFDTSFKTGNTIRKEEVRRMLVDMFSDEKERMDDANGKYMELRVAFPHIAGRPNPIIARLGWICKELSKRDWKRSYGESIEGINVGKDNEVAYADFGNKNGKK